MSEVKLNTKAPPSVQLVIPSVKDIVFSYVRAYGYEPVDDNAIWFEGDSATVNVLLGKHTHISPNPKYGSLSQESLSITLD